MSLEVIWKLTVSLNVIAKFKVTLWVIWKGTVLLEPFKEVTASEVISELKVLLGRMWEICHWKFLLNFKLYFGLSEN